MAINVLAFIKLVHRWRPHRSKHLY